METKDGAVIFLALLSLALFTTLAYSVWHNGTEIAQLQAELQNVKESVGQEESTSQNAASHLPAKVGLALAEVPAMPMHNRLRRSTKYAGGSAIHRLTAAQSELKRSRRSAEPGTVQLLADALSEIVGGELEALLDCDTDDNSTKCTIEPGPKGDRGPIGLRGDKGDTGEQGSTGRMGEKGVKGNRGYPGYKGEVGPKGSIGESGPNGLSGEKGEKGNLGYPGYKGEVGSIGERGPTGPRGEKGGMGHRGHKGERGSLGVQGPVGPSGEKGGKGEHGYTGFKGEKGQKGNVGPQGEVGPQGAVGPQGPVANLTQNGCSWQYTDTCGHGCGRDVTKRTTCPVGQYVAGYGSVAVYSYGRYSPHILCCPLR